MLNGVSYDILDKPRNNYTFSIGSIIKLSQNQIFAHIFAEPIKLKTC